MRFPERNSEQQHIRIDVLKRTASGNEDGNVTPALAPGYHIKRQVSYELRWRGYHNKT